MGLYQGNSAVCSFFPRDICHIVGNRIRKQNDQVRVPNEAVQITFLLGKNFHFAAKFFTDVPVLAMHPVVSADYDHTHSDPLLARRTDAATYSILANPARQPKHREFHNSS
jgi:hypothetical protein